MKVSRLIPQNIALDKESLYGKNLQLKQRNNALAEENLKLRSKLLQYEEEIKRKERQLNELLGSVEGGYKHGCQVLSSVM